MKRLVALGIAGTVLDAARGTRRWDRWRPSVSLFQHDELLIDRFELLHGDDNRSLDLAGRLRRDVRTVSPETDVRLHACDLSSPWDFQKVYATLHDFARGYDFKPDEEDYLVHITTGTHVAQICLFLLTESHHLPGKLVQTAPPRGRDTQRAGEYSIIDLDLGRYDALARRFAAEHDEAVDFLKAGIATRDVGFNEQMDQLEQVVLRSTAPILLLGPTGAGKSQLARRLFELKKQRHQLDGRLAEINCATLRGDAAMSALFGHKRGAFTGAVSDRGGLLRAADGGVLFLDEIGELGLDEQAMLLRAIEEGSYLPVGADREERSEFQLIAGTNRDLARRVASGHFREDLLARIDLWTFRLPGLRDRLADLEPNLDFELDLFARKTGKRVGFNKEARARYLEFATSPRALWSASFRDLNASVTRMATLAPGGRIDVPTVDEELRRLSSGWSRGAGELAGDAADPSHTAARERLRTLLGDDAFAKLDRFDRVQLVDVVAACRRARSLSEAGRELFAVSRERRRTANDADRLRKYLAKFELRFEQLRDEVDAAAG